MVQRTARERLQLQAEKRAARLEVRRRDLRERYPDIPPQVWGNMGKGLGGVGGKALREWLCSLGMLLAVSPKTSSQSSS